MNTNDYRKLIIKMLKLIESEGVLIKIYTMVEFWLNEQQGKD